MRFSHLSAFLFMAAICSNALKAMCLAGLASTRPQKSRFNIELKFAALIGG